MPNILLLGVTGYIGGPLALSLIRAGTHHVFGVARKAEAATSLAASEITPIIGQISDPAFLKSAITEYDIDVVINVSSAHMSSEVILNAIIEAGKERAAILKAQELPVVGPKLGYIYTSGSGIYGSPTQRRSDRSILTGKLAKSEPAALAKLGKIVENEQLVLQAREVLDVGIVRPHLVYGRSSWALGGWFGPLVEAKNKGGDQSAVFEVQGYEDAIEGFVHVDDVVAGMHAVVDQIEGRLGTWPIFDLVGETLRARDVIQAGREALGIKAEPKYVGPQGNPFLELLNGKTISEASRARTVLGWTPKRTEFLLNIGTYLRAFEAALDGKSAKVTLDL